MESYVISMDVGAARDSSLLLVTSQQGGLTQGLVVVVILIVIALALILICGLLGRREDARSATVGQEELEELSVAQTSPSVESSAQPTSLGVVAERGGVVQADVKGVTEGMTELVEPAAIDEPLVAETTAEPVMPPSPSQTDDLKRVEGIGPKVSSLLNGSGIFTFAQLAGTDVDRLRAIVDEAGLTMMNPTSWPEQARLAAAGDWDTLARLQDELKGGRAV